MWSSWGAWSVHSSCWAGVEIICHPDYLQDPKHKVLTKPKDDCQIKSQACWIDWVMRCRLGSTYTLQQGSKCQVWFPSFILLQDILSTLSIINFSLSCRLSIPDKNLWSYWSTNSSFTGVAWKQTKTQSPSHQECVHPVRGFNANYKRLWKIWDHVSC